MHSHSQLIPAFGLAVTIVVSACEITKLHAEELPAPNPPADRAAVAAEPVPIAGGTFEASGVIAVPGTSGLLFVDDGRNGEIFWMELTETGTQRAKAVRVPLGANVTDIEGITYDGTWYYVVGSQSKTKGYEGDGLVRFKFDAATRRVSDVQRVQGLKAWLASQVPQFKGTERQLGDQVLNIEAIAWDPRTSRLLLGLRAPVVDGKALIVPLKMRDGTAPLAAANLHVDGELLTLDLGGAGIRSLEYDAAAKAFRLITAAALNDETRDFRLLEWDGSTGAATFRELATYARALKPEGITPAVLDGHPTSVIVFDTGRFAVLP